MTNLRPRSCGCSKLLGLLFVLAVIVAPVAVALSQQTHSNEELLALSGEAGTSGGRMVVSLRAEPKILIPGWAPTRPRRKSSAPCRPTWSTSTARHTLPNLRWPSLGRYLP